MSPRGFLLLLSLVAVPAHADTIAIPRNAVWKYNAGPDSLADSWRGLSYDDTGWPSGPGPLGYGDPFIATTIPYGPNPSDKWRTTYFRKTFTIADDPDTLTTLWLNANYDDGFVAYLNGAEIARASMPAGPPQYSTFAQGHEGGAYEGFDRSGSVGLLAQGLNVLAVEVHQSSTSSTDLAHDMELIYAGGPRVVRGPYLQGGTSSEITIRWRTNLLTDSRVRFDTTLALAQSADQAAVSLDHEVVLTGLAPETRYFYSVGTTTETLDGADSSHSFVTAPLPGSVKPTRVWVIGDSGLPGASQSAVRNAYQGWTGTRPTDLWLMLGDNAYSTGTDTEYQAAVFDAYPEMLRRLPLWPTRGNHDFVHAGAANDYYDIFTLPAGGGEGGLPSTTEAYYSFDYANIHFVCLDSEGSDRTPGGAMATWLRNDLAATARDWVVAFWHHPPYTKGSHDSDNPGDSGGRMRDMRQNLLPILDSAGVDVVLTGHSHSYERSFLLNGHYGTSTTLTSAMKVDSADGRVDGAGPYEKTQTGTTPFSGAVYAVAGSSAQTSGGLLNHPVMIASMNLLGSMVLDVEGLRLDARFLDHNGVVRDSFTIQKGIAVSADLPSRTAGLGFVVSGPNPFRRETTLEYRLPAAGRARVSIYTPDGRRVLRLLDRMEPAGLHHARWDGRDAHGHAVPSGVYFGAIEWGGERRATRLVLTR